MRVVPLPLLVLAACLGSAALAEAPWQPLAGEWTLNASLSDGKAGPAKADEGRPPGRGGPPPGGGEGGGPGGPGMGGGGPRGGPGGEARGARPPRVGAEKSLLVALEPNGVRVSADGGDVRILVVGGEPVERPRGGGTVTETVSWEGGALLVRAVSPDGRTATERFSVGEDGRLVHSLTLPGRDEGTERSFLWVYDRAGAPKSKK